MGSPLDPSRGGHDPNGRPPQPGQPEEPWTRVVRKGKKLARRVRSPPRLNFRPRPNPAPQLTVDDIRADHDRLCSRWRQSEACARLRALLRDAAASHAPVTRAVCLGLGSFDPEDGSWDAKRRAHTQLEAFSIMVEHLSHHSTLPVTCVFQEPCFTAADRAFLEGMGHTVLDSPQAYAAMGPDALVFGVHLYKEVWGVALDKYLPALFVGTGWDVWDRSLGVENVSGVAKIREMDRTFDKFAFPEHDLDTFSSTSIYWRKRDGAPEQASYLQLDP